MTDIIERLAREAGFEPCGDESMDPNSPLDAIARVGEYPCGEDLARFAALVAEECAKVCYRQAEIQSAICSDDDVINQAMRDAADIRRLFSEPSAKPGKE